MAFEVRDYYDFVRLLYQHPEWQEELGKLLIAKEIRELPQVVRELAEAQKRTEQRVEELAEAQKRSEERLTRLETAVVELAEAQKRSEERLTRLETAVAELAEAQKRTEQRVEELAEAQKRSEERLTRLEGRVEKLTTRVGEVSGYMLEARYRQRPLAYLSRLLTEARVAEVTEVLPAESGLTEDEWQELLALDVLIQGRLRPSFAETLGVSEIWLAVEVSGLVEYPDVARAWERAELLKRCGLWPVVGVVSGKEMTETAARAVDDGKKVLVELERRLVNLESILTYLKAEAGRGRG